MTKHRLTPEELSAGMERATTRGKRTMAADPAKAGHDHFTACLVCGQTFDIRDLDQVLYHAQGKHDPLPL